MPCLGDNERAAGVGLDKAVDRTELLIRRIMRPRGWGSVGATAISCCAIKIYLYATLGGPKHNFRVPACVARRVATQTPKTKKTPGADPSPEHKPQRFPYVLHTTGHSASVGCSTAREWLPASVSAARPRAQVTRPRAQVMTAIASMQMMLCIQCRCAKKMAAAVLMHTHTLARPWTATPNTHRTASG